MVNSMVARATSDMLIGPDWAMNIEISDMLNHDPVQAKDIVKGIKRRIRRSKKPKVQFLALSLLETIVKNCGDIVHMHVAEKDVPHEMVKIAKKKCDYQVKEKILILIDTWQEAFGGSRARYPQYFAAYQELLRAGAVFPPRSERSAPVATPPQSHPLSTYSQNARNSALNHEGARSESSVEAEYPTLSLSEIQNARGSMDVLAEMINAIDPVNKESLKQEALVDLVEQCRTYKQRVVHLVNSTVDESLLCQGLALNDDLQRVLAKYESVVSRDGDKDEKSTPESMTRDLVDMGSPPQLIDAGDSSEQGDQRSTSPSAANGTATTPKADPKMDLLSGDLLGGDDFGSPTQNSLALVPVSVPQPSTPVASEQNALVLFDMFSENPQQGGSPYQNGGTPKMGSPYDQSGYPQVSSPSWGAQSTQLPQQSPSPSSGAQNGGSLPPPPWELPATDDTQPFGDPYPPTIQSPRMHSLGLPTPGNEQVVGMYVQPITGSQLAAINQPFQTHMYPQHLQGAPMAVVVPQAMQPTQMTAVYPEAMYGHQMAGYGYINGYGQQPEDAQYIDQRMYSQSVKDDTALNGSAASQASMASYLPPMKQQPKGDDKLFGDLVNMAKLKPTTSAPPGRTESM